VNFIATSTSKIRVHLIETAPNQSLYWDDLQLMTGWTEDFETANLTPWSVYGTATESLTAVVANSGIYSLAETNCLASGGVYRDIAGVLAGQAYRVTARTLSSAGATASAVLVVHDSTGANQAIASGSPTPGSWNEFAVTFVATNSGKLRVHLGCGGGSGSIYWDDLLITNTRF
jgi:hypothetical protein